MIEVMFAVRKDGFKDHPVIPEGLDLVEEEDQFTHMLPLEDEYNPDDILSEYDIWEPTYACMLQNYVRASFQCFLFSFWEDVFKMDPEFMDNEEKYKALKKGTWVQVLSCAWLFIF